MMWMVLPVTKRKLHVMEGGSNRNTGKSLKGTKKSFLRSSRKYASYAGNMQEHMQKMTLSIILLAPLVAKTCSPLFGSTGNL